MARARNIKPGFFKNEDLAECSSWARLLFAGLWTLADREGRLEDRAKRIKGELFAYDSIEVEPLLVELEARGFLVRYRNSDGSFIQISKFATHQTPHYSEKPSVIKPPETQESPPDDDPDTPRGLPEDSGKTQVIKRGSQPPDSLNPDSLNPEEEMEPRNTLVLVGAPSAPTPYRRPSCPTEEIVALFHGQLPALPRVEIVSDGRKRHVSARWAAVCGESRYDRQQGLDWFAWFFGHVAKSAFLTGRVKGRNGEPPFRCTFDFLMTPEKFTRVIENFYHKETA